MITLKLIFGFMLGLGLYGFMAYYQPVTESYASTQQAEAQSNENREVDLAFICPIPYELVMYPAR